MIDYRLRGNPSKPLDRGKSKVITFTTLFVFNFRVDRHVSPFAERFDVIMHVILIILSPCATDERIKFMAQNLS